MDARDRQVDVIQQLVVEFHGIASRKEDHDLLVFVPLQEGEEQQETALRRTHHIALCETADRRHVVLRLHFNKDRLAEREASQVGHLPCLRRGEEGRLPLLRQHLYNQVHLLLESDLEATVGLVDGQIHEVVENEPLRVLHVVQESSGRGHQRVHALGEFLGLLAAVHSAHTDGEGLRQIRRDGAEHIVDLHRKLSRGRNDKRADTVPGQELDIVQQVRCWHQEGERLSAACLRCREHVFPSEERRDRLRLDLSENLKLGLLQRLLQRLTDREL
mmetsp:Transcript_130736/g.279617  ORF Transcript_130736/g.279617 Transcript_130736/m.279617 type:complete len:274 (-) Transcript_130736:589-1410(-)